MEVKKEHKPLKMRLAKLFNKGKRTASVPEVCNVVSDTVDTEMEALHISRTDNPYIQVLSSQDHLDQAAESSVVMSPDSISPTRSYEATKEYSLSEIHSHLVRSPPPVSWPLSPRSNGTFSPDSSDMDVDNPPLILPPKRGYSPYNRSQSEEHILSPCRELLKSAEFSPVRGTTPELLAVSMTAEGGCISPYRDFDTVSSSSKMRSGVGRTASFISSTGSNYRHYSGNNSLRQSRNAEKQAYNRSSSSNFYYTMTYNEEEPDSGLMSPNRNQMFPVGGRPTSRRSIGGLSLSPMTMSMTSSAGPTSAPIVKNSGFFASWRRSYRLRSKSSTATNEGTSRSRKDTKSMENLLDSERMVPRYSLDFEDELEPDDK